MRKESRQVRNTIQETRGASVRHVVFRDCYTALASEAMTTCIRLGGRETRREKVGIKPPSCAMRRDYGEYDSKEAPVSKWKLQLILGDFD